MRGHLLLTLNGCPSADLTLARGNRLLALKLQVHLEVLVSGLDHVDHQLEVLVTFDLLQIGVLVIQSVQKLLFEVLGERDINCL